MPTQPQLQSAASRHAAPLRLRLLLLLLLLLLRLLLLLLLLLLRLLLLPCDCSSYPTAAAGALAALPHLLWAPIFLGKGLVGVGLVLFVAQPCCHHQQRGNEHFAGGGWVGGRGWVSVWH
jgi:hypothetical protein